MKGKINIRYIDFTSARNGNRIFNFSISTEEQIDAPASVEFPLEFLVGVDRIPFQDCAGIGYAKLQPVVEIGPSDLPRRLRLTASDISEFRKPSHILGKRKHGFVAGKRAV